MRGSVDLAQPVDRDQGVDLRGRDRGVAEKFLDYPDVSPAVQHVRGERVPQGVRGYVGFRVQAGAAGGGAQHAPGALPGQAPAAGVEEDRRGPPQRCRGEGRPGPDQVGFHGAHGVAAHRHHPVFAALADQTHHRVRGVQLEFVDIQAGRLGDPGPGPVEELE
jgi:hypothetical protein